ncbi:MAG: trimeric intracellular cation channel family protein [Nocardioidaceae bacterium]
MSTQLPEISSTVTDALRWLDLTGVLANALLGGLVARSAKLDPAGFAILAILSGLGGGLIRDVLLQHGTPIALTDYAYVLTALAGATLAFVNLVDQVIETAQRVVASGAISANGHGNVSIRVPGSDEKYFTAGPSLRNHSPAAVVRVGLDGALREGDLPPIQGAVVAMHTAM